MANHEERFFQGDRTVPHTQRAAYSTLALSVIEDALDAVKDEADEEALAWIQNPHTGALTLSECAAATPRGVDAVQREAQRRLVTYHDEDDPIEHDEVGSLSVLDEHRIEWVSKKRAAETFGVSLSMIQTRIETGEVQSVLAPRSEGSGYTARYVPLSSIRALFG
jgi:hypothetical protein